MGCTFESVRRTLSLYLMYNNLYENFLELISSLKTDSERFYHTYLSLKEADLLPSFSPIEGKCKETSDKHRIKGNQAFLNQKDLLAIQQYTLAIGYAPTESKELALAHANRSAVTSSLGEHRECIKDINSALESDYPDNLKYKLFERKGKSLLQIGFVEEAVKCLEAALEYLSQGNLTPEKEMKTKDSITDLLETCKKSTLGERKEKVKPLLPIVEKEPHKTIESASSVIDICYTEEMGRHLVANCDIKPGTVLAVEKPFASVLLPNSYPTHCFLCQERCHSLLPCLHCPNVFFCSEKCRDASWSESHQVECPVLPSLLSLGSNKMELLAVRILLKATNQGNKISELAQSLPPTENVEHPEEKGFIDGRYLSSEYITTHHLEGNTHLRETTDLLQRGVTAVCILEALDQLSSLFEGLSNEFSEETKISLSLPMFDKVKYRHNDVIPWKKVFSGGLILRYLQSLPCNAHEVSEMFIHHKGASLESTSNEIGGAVYPLLSLTNHSCDPNVVRHSYSGDTVVLTAIQAIETGQQIFDNYGYHHAVHDLKYRKSCLEKQYFFICQCIACVEDWPLYGDLPDKVAIYINNENKPEVEESTKIFNTYVDEILAGNVGDKLPFLYSHLYLLQQNIKRPWKDYSICQEAIKQCLSLTANHYMYYRSSM